MNQPQVSIFPAEMTTALYRRAIASAWRQKMLNDLYRWYTKNGCGEDFTDDKWPGQENGYWKNRLRTASTSLLRQIYKAKIGGNACI